MTEHLTFGFDESHQMVVDAPTNIVKKVQDKGEYFDRIITFGRWNQRVVTLEDKGDQTRVVLNTKKAGNLAKYDLTKRDRCRQMMVALGELIDYTPSEQYDPKLELEIGVRLATGGEVCSLKSNGPRWIRPSLDGVRHFLCVKQPTSCSMSDTTIAVGLAMTGLSMQ